MTEWQSADERNNREKINRARQAAEDLFKRTQQTPPVDAPTQAPDAEHPAGPQPRRQPRIFAMPPLMRESAKEDLPAKPKRMRRKAVVDRDTGAALSSQAGRIRALTSYGMTRAQVAELYGVGVDEIDRIVRRPAYFGKS